MDRSKSSSYGALGIHCMQIRVEGSEIKLLTMRRCRLPAAGLVGVSGQPEGKITITIEGETMTCISSMQLSISDAHCTVKVKKLADNDQADIETKNC